MIIKKGVTLVEVLVASIILAISISGILYLFVENLEMTIENEKRLIAYNILNDKLEILNNIQDQTSFLSYIANNASSENTITTVNNNDIKYTTTLSDYGNKSVYTNKNWGQDDSFPHLKAVEVVVTWEKTKSIKQTLIAKPKY